MKQLSLLEVPKDSPGRNDNIRAFKKKVGIWTHSSGEESTTEYPKWMAMLMPVDGDGMKRYDDHRAYCKSDEPNEIIAGYCRILQDSGRIDYGHTERDAIKNLCSENRITCDL